MPRRAEMTPRQAARFRSAEPVRQRSLASARRLWLLSLILASLLGGGLCGSVSAQQSSTDQPPLQFIDQIGGEPVHELGPLREGYVTLAWTGDPRAAGYRVFHDSGRVMYEGRVPEAFLSGLPDGIHHFRVVSVDARGEVIRQGPEPVRVTVQHWPLRRAWTVFGIGAVTVLALVVVLVIGARRDRKAATG